MAGILTQEASIKGVITPSENISGEMSASKIYYEGTSKPATKDTLGLVKIGNNLAITEDGLLSAEVPTKVSELDNDSGYITADQAPVQSVNGQTGAVVIKEPKPYELPVASADILGGVKIGSGLKIQEDVLSVDVATKAEEDNTKPITSAAVNTLVGNIDALLSTI